MTMLKCKMCGGDLDMTEGMSVCECEYCGTRQTVPTADNEKKMTLFGRANRLRAANEFDKASGIFENIVAEFPEEAEAYWGLVLCKYGIEYVDDPASGKKVPTCHRSSFDSVLEDVDFEQACENADGMARRQYREEAKQIEEIRKGIIEVSGKEEPYDIFICYKETDENGDRTIDSVIAQDVYDALTSRGYRVFFSRISLEDKLGTEYEPYIFAALNSAKIMLAFGSDYDYYNAVWVKNEWSRFLRLMERDKEKHLIPCYKDIDAYDMPKEFTRLQAQDMGKVGAIQDLVRGIDKLMGRDMGALKTSASGQTEIHHITEGSPNATSLTERGNMFLEDGKFGEAEQYFDRALDIDPKSSEAYLGLFMSGIKARNRDAAEKIFVSDNRDPSRDKNWNRAKEFASNDLLNELNEWEAARNARIQGIATDPEAQKLKDKLHKARIIANFVETRVCLGASITVGLKPDGTTILLCEGSAQNEEISRAAEWTDIESFLVLSGKDARIIGKKEDGTIVVTRNREGMLDDQEFVGSKLTSDKGFKSITAGESRLIYGLKNNGTVVCASKPRKTFSDFGLDNTAELENVEEILSAAFQVICRKKDGTLESTKFTGKDRSIEAKWNEIAEWKDIIKLVFFREGDYIGLKSDGHLVVTSAGEDSSYHLLWDEIQHWNDIVDVIANLDDKTVIGLTAFGDVLSFSAIGNSVNGAPWAELSKWKNVVKLYENIHYVAGLLLDGSIKIIQKKDSKSKRDIQFINTISGWKSLAGFTMSIYGDAIGISSDGSLKYCSQSIGARLGRGNRNGICNYRLFDDAESFYEESLRRRKVLEQKQRQRAAFDEAYGKIEREIHAELDPIVQGVTKEHEEQIQRIMQEMQDEIEDNKRTRSSINDEIVSLTRQKSTLGFFQGKVKKELQAKIDEAQNHLDSLESEQNIRDKYKPEIDRAGSEHQERIDRITKEIQSKYTLPTLEDFAEI